MKSVTLFFIFDLIEFQIFCLELENPKARDRVIAFWCVVGFACAAIVLLTITDLPFEDLCLVLGCSTKCFRCSSSTSPVEKVETKRVDLSNFRPNVAHSGVSPSSIPEETTVGQQQPSNYQMMCKVWNSEKKCYETTTNPPIPPSNAKPQHTNFHQISIAALTSAVIKSQPKRYPSIPAQTTPPPPYQSTDWETNA